MQGGVYSLFFCKIAMQVNEEPATWAAAGDSVLMTLVNLDIMNLRYFFSKLMKVMSFHSLLVQIVMDVYCVQVQNQFQ